MFFFNIVICTYNGSETILDALKSIKDLKTNELFIFDLLIVDNNSTDNTYVLCHEYLINTSLNFKIISEPQQGLIYARKCAWLHTKGTVICFCDDDNILDSNYLITAFNILSSNPSIGILGGKVEAIFKSKKPVWFDQFHGFYAVGEQNTYSGDISTIRGWVFGAGMLIKKESFPDFVTHSFLSIGRMGSNLLASEDKEIAYLVLLKGYKIFYSDLLYVQHIILERRLSLDYLYKLLVGIYSTLPILDGLLYRSKAQSGWFNKWYKRKWWFRIILIILDISIYKRFKPLSFLQILKIQFAKIRCLLQLRSKYNVSFLN